MSKKHVFVCCSLDVEEEGLFRGSYATAAPQVSNLAFLKRLRPLLEMQVRPTLFCACPVLADDGAWGHIEHLARDFPLEIGAHLHHWNTPPLSGSGTGPLASVPSCRVPPNLMEAKLAHLVDLCTRRCGQAPASFRMGRWDLHRSHWPLLARAGFTADASVRPLHAGSSRNLGPDHFDAPMHPYLVQVQGRTIFELPLTVTHLASWLSRAVSRLPRASGLRASFHSWGVLALLPVYHPLWAMKAITRRALDRGTPVLSLTWHSSELMPGGNPHLPDEAAITRFLDKIRDYLVWLSDCCTVRYTTLAELRQTLLAHCPAAPAAHGDWTYASAGDDASPVMRSHA